MDGTHNDHRTFGSDLQASDVLALRPIALEIRAAGWQIAQQCVEQGIAAGVLAELEQLEPVERLSNLPAFIGALATSLTRPSSSWRPRSLNPVLLRLASDHVVAREAAGFSQRQVVQEFLMLRRVLWRFVQSRSHLLDTRTVLGLEDRLNSVLDEVIAECTVIYFDRATHELSERSRRDSLTGLLNHQALYARLDRELDRARRYGHELQVVYCDLDDFKAVNDEHGHHSGDAVLKSVAGTILDSIRESDFAGRMGGDEFVLVLVESSQLAAHLLIDRLRGKLAELVASGDVAGAPSLSAGCAGFPDDADTSQDLLVVADRRLYDDKRHRKTSQ